MGRVKMTRWMENRRMRFLLGVIFTAVLLTAAFAMIYPALQLWGSTSAEAVAQMPGDELLDRPIVKWSHAETINAPVEQVWPWGRRFWC